MDKIFTKKLQKRDFYLEKIKKFLNTPFVKVIIGQRRVGKSSLLIQTLQYLVEEKGYDKNQIFYINKEFPEYDEIATYKDLNKVLIDFVESTVCPKVIAIDEIQEIKDWEKSINGILSKYKEVEIFLTGSNSHMLSGELATLLSGRYVEIHVFPMTYDEAKAISGDSNLSFDDYLHFGGLPETYFSKDELVKNSYLQSVYNTVVLKDIISRYKVKNLDFFGLLYKYIFKNIGNIFSAKNISDYLKSQKINISVNSVLEYLNYGENSFIINKIKSQDIKTKKIFSIYNKYYVGDLGIRNALVGYKISEDIGGILENYVFLVLKKYGYNVQIGRIGDKEVDFIAEKNGNLMYIQVATTILDENTREREYKSLEMIRDSWLKFVVSMDNLDFGVRNGIKHIKVEEFEEILKKT